MNSKQLTLLAGSVFLTGVFSSMAQESPASDVTFIPARTNTTETATSPDQTDLESARQRQIERDLEDARRFRPGPANPAEGASRGVPLAGTSQLGGVPVGGGTMGGGGEAGGVENPFQWNMFTFRPHLMFSSTYGNSIQSGAGNRGNTWAHQFSPGLAIDIGKNWVLDYTPTWRWYSDSQLKDGLDHSVSLSGHASYNDWGFTFGQGFSISSQPLIETGAQTEQEAWSTSFGASRALNSKVSIDLGLNQNLRFVNGNESPSQNQPNQFNQFSDTKSWSTMDWVNYEYVKQLTFSAGAGFTYDDVSVGSDMTSELVQGRVMWAPGLKLTLTASGGVDIRQFLDSNSSTMVSPIFSLNARYKLFENTTLSLSGSRGVTPSYFANSVTETTGVNAGISQRLLGRLFLNVSGGWGSTSYTGTANGGAGVPSGLSSYDSTTFSASLGTAFLKRGSASVFYSKTFNNSNSALFNYDPQSIGAQISYTY